MIKRETLSVALRFEYKKIMIPFMPSLETKYKCNSLEEAHGYFCPFAEKETKNTITKRSRARVPIGGKCVILQISLRIKYLIFFKAKVTV